MHSSRQLPRVGLRRLARGAGVLGLRLACLLAPAGLSACAATPPGVTEPAPSAAVVIESPAGTPRPPFAFSPEDAALLESVQRGCFNFFWNAAHPTTGMVPDRSTHPMVSVAGVGFQLSAIIVGAERGWVTRAQAEQRTLLILRTLDAHPENRRFGMFFHFLDASTGGQPDTPYEHVASTIDTALFLAGAITSSTYFGGEVKTIADRLIEECDWKAFAFGDDAPAFERGMIRLAWEPDDIKKPLGPGKFTNYGWIDAGDEHRLVTFLAVMSPRAEHRIDPAAYYRLRRALGQYENTGPLVYFPWSGALFTSFFAHCWMDYRAMGVDDPMALGVINRPRVDWWENARRTTLLHRIKSAKNPWKITDKSEHEWGLSASDAPPTKAGEKATYAVPGFFPDPIADAKLRRDIDIAVARPPAGRDQIGDGTFAPYTAGSTIMFDPQPAIAAMRYYKELKNPDGTPRMWSDPASGGYGFRDSINRRKNWVAEDYVAIDQGPLILAIENARTGLLWRLFHEHPFVRAGVERLKLPPVQAGVQATHR